MKVLGYARVSTENQVKAGSLEDQKAQIRKFCELQGHELLEILCDAGLSALAERPAWNRAMQLAREGKIEAIVVTKLDRWGRSVKDLVTSIDELRRLGVHFISIGDNLDTSTPNGRLLFHILSAFAEFEREIIRERMQAGRERAKAQGKACHRPRKKLDEREIRRLYELGLSARDIGRIMGVSHNTILSRLREMGVRIR
ncbi:MAG: recombinase family protein [Candidatus Bipolaricaulota bacterium]|nr:recombinase family protein [Candidatus Bipolaricaulota bacterium]MDW8126984.1 recombinase family protein [Candidatus Bipolaricaulota bacterium]